MHEVYKRVTEAYFVLRDDTRRRKYLADVTGPDRARKLRFDELSEKETQAAVKQQAQEQIGTHPKGRQLFQTGMAELERGQLAAAERSLKMALTYEPAERPLQGEAEAGAGHSPRGVPPRGEGLQDHMTLDLIVLALVALGRSSAPGPVPRARSPAGGRSSSQRWSPGPGHRSSARRSRRAFHTSPSLGAVAAGFAIFIIVAVLVRLVATAVLRGVLAGRDPADRGTDRALGFLLGAVKVLAVAWVALSALAFVEDNVQVAGKGLGISPKDSTAFAAARKWNLFAAPAFSQAADLVKAQEVFRSPQLFAQVASEPAVAELQKNRYFRAVFADPEVKAALERGDTLGLLKLDSVHRLLAGPRGPQSAGGPPDGAGPEHHPGEEIGLRPPPPLER